MLPIPPGYPYEIGPYEGVVISPGRIGFLEYCRPLSETAMRCYFMKDGHIALVEPLTQTTDEGRIAEARELFELNGKARGAEGFEVWDGGRFVYRYPEAP